MDLFELKDVNFHLSNRFELRIEEFTLARGEKVAVMGRNGSGKTTFLRLLGFLDRPTSAACFNYRGRPLASGAVDRTGLGFLKQQPYLFRGSVRQNLAYPLQLRGRRREEVRARVTATLELVDLTAEADAAARSLSGGEQKRLALGRVLIAEPELLLLDEPAAHLDRRSRSVIDRALMQTRAAIVVTTHDLHFAHRIAGRVLNLQAGRISPGLPENVLTGRRVNDHLVTEAGLEISLPPETAKTDPQDTLAVMLDPRSLVLSREPLTSSMRNQILGRVCSVSGQGKNVWLEIDCGDHLTSIISRASYDELNINLDMDVVVSFKANAVEVL